MPLYFDKFFKMIFANKNDLKYIKYLISLTLNKRIEKIALISPEELGDKYNTKASYLDLLVELEDKSKVNVEVNTNPKSYVFDRNLFYLFKVMGNDLKVGDDYSNLHKHIQINLNANIRQKKDVMIYKLINLETKDILSEKLEIINIDIVNLSEKCYNEGIEKQSEFTKLMGLIGSKDQKHLDLFKGEKGIMEEIINKADEIRDDRNLVDILDYEKMRDSREVAARKLGYEEGMKQGKDQGIKEGIKEGILLTAKEMLNKSVEINLISEITGLTVEQVNNLK